jgi:hypothetical protein
MRETTRREGSIVGTRVGTRPKPGRLVLGLVLITAILLAAGFALGATRNADLKGANRVPGVKPFSRDVGSGSMALHALTSCLGAYGPMPSYYRLVTISGAGFKFVYDTTEAYEPLRDLFPVDVLQTASVALGFTGAHWETGKSIKAMELVIKREVDAGHPLITSNLINDTYHGFAVVAGYDFATGVLLLQGVLGDTSYTSVPIPASWSGPTASPSGWATNPVFVIGEPPAPSEQRLDLDKTMVETGIAMLKGGTLAYGTHPGEAAYLGSPGPHKATYGIPAYRLLAADVGNGALILSRPEGDSLNFALIWRLDSQLGQLEHDRRNAAVGLDYLTSRVAGGKSVAVDALRDNVEKTAADAKEAATIFWDLIPFTVNTVDGIANYVGGSRSIVFSFAGRDALFNVLKDKGFQVFKTPRGPALVADSPWKRLQARIVVKSLESREKVTLHMMEEIVSYIGADLGVPAPEPKAARRRNK